MASRRQEETYFYRAGRRRALEKAPDVIGVSFTRGGAPPPQACALPEGVAAGTNLRRLAFLRPRSFGVFCLEPRTAAADRALRGRRDSAMDTLREVERTAFVSHAYRSVPSADAPVLVLSEEIVAETPDLTVARLRAVLARRGARHVRTLDHRRRVHLLRVTDEAGMNALKVANRLVEEGLAAAAEPNFVRRLPYRRVPPAAARRRGGGRRRDPPSDPLFRRQWHLENTGSGGATRGADVGALDAWEVTTGNRAVVVAIVDDGLDLDHPEFSGRGKLRPGWNFHDDDDDPAAPPENRHGTACAGIAVARKGNGRGGCGVAPECALMPVRTPDEWGDEVGYADAVAWAADHGAHVLSCSWGPPDGYWAEDPLPLAMDAALDRAVTEGRDGRGAVIVWAAGNGNEPVDLDGFASDPRVVAVAASDDRDRKASYSDFGAAVAVCAPSGDDLRDRPGIWTTDLSGRAGYAAGDYTSAFSGTSAAAPMVAGVAALVLSVHPELGWREVKDLLRETAQRIDPEGAFTDARGGSHDAAYVDGQSPCYGAGRVNAAAAVRRAAELAAPSVPRVATGREGASRQRRKRGRRQPSRRGAEEPRELDAGGLYFHRGGRKIPLRRVSAARSGGRAAGGPTYVIDGGDPDCVLVPTGQVVVQFAPGVGPDRVSREARKRGARVVRALDYLPNGYLWETTPAGMLRLANHLHEQPFVSAAEPNWLRRTPRR